MAKKFEPPMCPWCDEHVPSLNCPCCGAEVWRGGPERFCFHSQQYLPVHLL